MEGPALTLDQKRQSYRLSLASRLSDDVLGHIFSFLVTTDHGPNNPTPESQISDCISKDAVRYVSQVCTYWRYLALGNPALWTNIDIGKYGAKAWSEEMIKRSHPMLLNIRCFNKSVFYGVMHDPDVVSRLRMVAVWYGDKKI